MATERGDSLGEAKRSPYDECQTAIDEFAREANKSQRLAWATSFAIVVASASIPVLIVISTHTGAFVYGKLLPAVLAGLVAIAAGGAQIARPHERWRSCRQHQLLLEGEQFSYLHRLGGYSADDRDRVLLERVVAVRRDALEEWRGFISQKMEKST